MQKDELQTSAIPANFVVDQKEAWVKPTAVAEKVQDVTAAGNTTTNFADFATCAS